MVPVEVGLEQGFCGSMAAAPKQSGTSLSTAATDGLLGVLDGDRGADSDAGARRARRRGGGGDEGGEGAAQCRAAAVKRTGSSTHSSCAAAARIAPTSTRTRAGKPMLWPRTTGR